MRFLLPPFFLACLALGAAFGRPGQEAEIQIVPVAGSVAVLHGQGGNIGVSKGPDGVLLIDGQFERLVDRIQKAVDEHAGAEGAYPRLLVNTHHHGDHTGGNVRFGEHAVIVAHENVRARLVEDGGGRPALPVVTYADGLSLHWNGEEIRVRHVPAAHTDGDSVVWFLGSNVVHMGDLFFQVGYPFVDVGSGGNVLGVIDGVRGVLDELPDGAKVIPGHGEVTDEEGLREYLAMLETITERVRGRLEAGESEDQIVAAGVTKDFDARWGNFSFVPPERFVRSVVASLR